MLFLTIVIFLLVINVNGRLFVSFTFDDNLSDHVVVSEILDKYRIKGTFYVNSGRLNVTAGTPNPKYATLSQIQNIKNRGHEIGGHTVNHFNLRTLSNADRVYQVCVDKQNLLDMGLDPKTFAFPFSGNYDGSNDLLKSCGYNVGRISNGIEIGGDCDGCPQYLTLPLNTFDTYNIRSISYRTWYTLDDIIGNIQTANGAPSYNLIVFVFHGVGNYDSSAIDAITVANLTNIIEWVVNRKDIAIVTMSQIFNTKSYETLYFNSVLIDNPDLFTNKTLQTTPSGISNSGVSNTVVNDNDVAMIVGITIGVVSFVFIVIAVIIICRKMRKYDIAIMKVKNDIETNEHEVRMDAQTTAVPIYQRESVTLRDIELQFMSNKVEV